MDEEEVKESDRERNDKFNTEMGKGDKKQQEENKKEEKQTI